MTIQTARGNISIETEPPNIAGMGGYAAKGIEKSRARALKDVSYLGPWCANCGRKGKTCKTGSKACRKRALSNAFKGCGVKSLFGVSLPAPPMEWCVEKGYADNSYHAGGRWREGTRPTIKSWIDHKDIAQEYAYEVSIGKAA